MWTGTVFNCDNAADSIILLHSRFDNNITQNSTICNGGAVVGQSLCVEYNQYTSQLNVTINSTLIGMNIVCSRDDGTNTHIVGCHTLSSNDCSCSNCSDHTGPGILAVNSFFIVLIIIIITIIIIILLQKLVFFNRQWSSFFEYSNAYYYDSGLCTSCCCHHGSCWSCSNQENIAMEKIFCP